MFHSTYLPKMKNSASSLNMLYTAECTQFYSRFLPTTISLTSSFLQKRDVWLCFFTGNDQNDPKTHSYEYHAEFNVAFSATTLTHASRFWRKQGIIKNFEYLCEFWECFQKGWLYWVLSERCKKRYKNRLCACVPLSLISVNQVWSLVNRSHKSPPRRIQQYHDL